MRCTTALCYLAVLAAVAAGSPAGDKLTRDLITIDGKERTIAQATAAQIDGTEVVLSFAELIFSIIQAFNEEEFDYWGNVREEVEALVGSFINEHNMNQVEAFQSDLETLLVRYLNAPEQSTDYPDKNKQASALSMAIISHRYLVMSGDMRYSLVLHFEDIASMHIVVLKDAAETYSTAEAASQWWVDLDEELEDYISYSATITQELEQFRMGMITCSVEADQCRANNGENLQKVCYDVYTVTDGVTGEESICKQLAGATDCTSHCETYAARRQAELDHFEGDKVAAVTDIWGKLKEISAEMAANASPYYEPINKV